MSTTEIEQADEVAQPEKTYKMTFEMTATEWNYFHAALLDAHRECKEYEANYLGSTPYTPLIDRVCTQIGTYTFA